MRPLRLAAPVLFALRRMRAQPLSVGAVAVAVAAAAALIGWSGVAATLAHEENVRLRLGEVSPGDRSLQIAYYVPPSQPDTRAATAATFFREFAPVTTPVRRVRIWHTVAPGVSLYMPAKPAEDVIVTKGRLPSACRGRVCEVLSLGNTFRLGQRVRLQRGRSALVVGRGSLHEEAYPFPSEALLGAREVGYDGLLVQSLEKPLEPLARLSGTTVLTTAILEPESVHGSEIGGLASRSRRALARVERSGPFIDGAAPLTLLDALSGRGEVARKRLLLVAGEAAALIVAFAAFAASARRRETRLLEEQLATLGATRAQVVLARALEAVVPVLVGAAVALAGLWAAVHLIADRRGLPETFVAVALPRETLLAIAALAAAAALLLFVSVTPRRPSRLGFGALELAALVALGVTVWQTVATGALDPEQIAAAKRGSPVLLLLPALAFFALGVLLLRVLPLALRLAERVARAAPPGVRLAFVSAARSPGQAAAATTFLAVALGAALFSLNYRATLDRQTRDEALFTAGAQWRVVERRGGDEQDRVRGVHRVGANVAPSIRTPQAGVSASDVTPLTRFARVSSERPTPILRLTGTVEEGAVSGEGLLVEVLALPAARVPDLVGWRESFSTAERSEIARRLRPRPLRLAGPRIAADARALRVRARGQGKYPRVAVLHFLLRREQRFERVPLGGIRRGWRTLRLRLPASLRGAELVAVEFPATFTIYSAEPDLRGFADLGRFEQLRSGGWSRLPTSEWTASATGGSVETRAHGLRFAIEGSWRPLMRPPLTLPEALPSLASDAVAAAAVDGTVTLDVLGNDVPVRVASRARLFPTVVERPAHFVVLDYDALFAALNLDRPGEALPSEAWFFERQRPAFAARLRERPFRLESVVGAEPLAARLLSDPLGDGTRDVLGLAALAAAALGLIGLVLATRSTLGSERGLLAEYEALGVPRRSLVRMTQARLLALSSIGLAGAVLGALVAVRLIAAFVAVTGTAADPLPPIATVVDWPAVAVVLAAVGTAALASSALLARWSLRETAARRLRA